MSIFHFCNYGTVMRCHCSSLAVEFRAVPVGSLSLGRNNGPNEVDSNAPKTHGNSAAIRNRFTSDFRPGCCSGCCRSIEAASGCERASVGVRAVSTIHKVKSRFRQSADQRWRWLWSDESRQRAAAPAVWEVDGDEDFRMINVTCNRADPPFDSQ